MDDLILKRIQKDLFGKNDFNRWMGQLGMTKQNSKLVMQRLIKKGKIKKIRGGWFTCDL